MIKQFVTYEIALKLKHLGFDELCFAHYLNGNMYKQRAILASSAMQHYHQNNINPNNQYRDQNCTAPLYQQVIDWLIDNHQLVVYCKPHKDDIACFVEHKTTGDTMVNIIDQSRHYAQEQAILQALEIIKTK